MSERKKTNSKHGFTLIEMMIFLLIFMLATITFYRTFTSGARAMGNVKNRLDALAVANQKMEIIHNLGYVNVGTIGGIPAGQIPENDVVTQDQRTFYTHTSIMYVDDPFDGAATLGTDVKPDDYKQVKISVSWELGNPSKTVTLVGSIVPPGIESIYTGGILSLHVVDNSGVGISNAQVTITNNAISPAVNMSVTTDSHGDLFLPEATPSDQTYHIQVSKSGYYPVETYAPYPVSSAMPIDVHASVVGGTINQKTIVTDKISKIIIKTITPLGEAVPNISFGLTGGRKMADTPTIPSQPVYAYDNQTLSTDSDGQKELTNVSSGQYTITYGSGSTNDDYQFLRMSNATTVANAFFASPGADTDASAIVLDKNLPSLLVSVVDDADGSAIPNATIALSDSDSGYNVTLLSDFFGHVYFPDSATPLEDGKTYKLSVSVDGYQQMSNQDVTIDKLTSKEIRLTAN